MKLGATFKKDGAASVRGIPKSILKVDKRRKKYLVEWKVPEGAEAINNWQPMSAIKAIRPENGLHKIEKAFWGSESIPKWVR
jgi:hypothetical protein